MKNPQRQDIWLSADNEQVYVVSVHNDIVNYVYSKDDKFFADNMERDAFIKTHKYITFSVADISELFRGEIVDNGLVFLNMKNNMCVVLKVENGYVWVFSKTSKGFCCNRYGKWWINRCINECKYRIIAKYQSWQEAINSEEF